MKIKRITNVKDLPRSKELVLYNAPFITTISKEELEKMKTRIARLFSDKKVRKEMAHAICCSVYEYGQKYDREPNVVYIHNANLFIPV